MTDVEIRAVLIPVLAAMDGIVKREAVFGDTRADLVRLTGRIIGYEIKGRTDSIWGDRAKKQIVEYNLLCDECWMAVDYDRIWEAEMQLPEHWGIIAVYDNKVQTVRQATLNNCISKKSLAESLHLSEIHDILRGRGCPLSRPKREAVKDICRELRVGELQAAVIHNWKNRKEDVPHSGGERG